MSDWETQSQIREENFKIEREAGRARQQAEAESGFQQHMQDLDVREAQERDRRLQAHTTYGYSGVSHETAPSTGDTSRFFSWPSFFVWAGTVGVIYYSSWWPKLLTDGAIGSKAIGLVALAALLTSKFIRKFVGVCVAMGVLAMVVANIAVWMRVIRYQQPTSISIKRNNQKVQKRVSVMKPQTGHHKQHHTAKN